MKKIAIVGNPNCGKTTLFNALTGANQKVGNWSGVTVDKKSGFFKLPGGEQVELIDLPGLYSLSASDKNSLDEQIASSFLAEEQPEAVINVIDAANIERHLYLTMQLLEMGLPVILAVNMVDVARSRGLVIHFDKLQKALNVRAVPVIGRKGVGIDDLVQATEQACHATDAAAKDVVTGHYKNHIQPFLQQMTAGQSGMAAQNWFALRLLENDNYAHSQADDTLLAQLEQARQQHHLKPMDVSVVRYERISEIMDSCCDMARVQKHRLTHVVDKICLNRFLGLPIFLFVMYLMFEFSITIGGALQPVFTNTANVIFTEGLAHLLNTLSVPVWLTAILAHGVGLGINTVVSFIPQIGCMFLFLCFLEDSGYMSRAAFVMDRFMQWVGLPGKSFVPLIVGFGCNVPAVMATRTLESRRDRLLTIMMSPFMSCGARLAIFAVFSTAFFGQNGALVVFLLYIIGIIAAVLTGLVIKNTILKGENTPFILELPAYHLPNIKSIFRQAWDRLKRFLTRAGKVIIPVCVLVGGLNTIQINGQVEPDGSRHSIMSEFGRATTPIFQPIGLKQDNWPATVGLMTGTLAKEVVVGTLNTLYSQNSDNTRLGPDQNKPFHFWSELKGSFTTTADNLASIPVTAFLNPFTANQAGADMGDAAMGNMVAAFGGSIAAVFAYLLFVLLYIPCVSTIGAMARESGQGWAWLSVWWSTSVAYIFALFAYQITQIGTNPDYALTAMGIGAAYMTILIYGMKYFADRMHFRPKLGSGCGTGCAGASQKTSGGCH